MSDMSDMSDNSRTSRTKSDKSGKESCTGKEMYAYSSIRPSVRVGRLSETRPTFVRNDAFLNI